MSTIPVNEPMHYHITLVVLLHRRSNNFHLIVLENAVRSWYWCIYLSCETPITFEHAMVHGCQSQSDVMPLRTVRYVNFRRLSSSISPRSYITWLVGVFLLFYATVAKRKTSPLSLMYFSHRDKDGLSVYYVRHRHI